VAKYIAMTAGSSRDDAKYRSIAGRRVTGRAASHTRMIEDGDREWAGWRRGL
jgi:hypothetical protein